MFLFQLIKQLESKCCIMKDYNPFITKWFVSLIGDKTSLQPITILRDTGASQTLMLENSLPLTWKISVGVIVLLQGINTGLHSVPLHHVNLKSNFVSGQVLVGVRPTLPVEGISLLLGCIAEIEKTIICETIEIIYRRLYFTELFTYYNQQSKWYFRQMNLCQIQRGKRSRY